MKPFSLLFIIIFVSTAQESPAGGNYLKLDGIDDYASAPDSDSLDVGDTPDESLTIEAWVYVENWPDAEEAYAVIADYQIMGYGLDEGYDIDIKCVYACSDETKLYAFFFKYSTVELLKGGCKVMLTPPLIAVHKVESPVSGLNHSTS